MRAPADGFSSRQHGGSPLSENVRNISQQISPAEAKKRSFDSFVLKRDGGEMDPLRRSWSSFSLRSVNSSLLAVEDRQGRPMEKRLQPRPRSHWAGLDSSCKYCHSTGLPPGTNYTGAWAQLNKFSHWQSVVKAHLTCCSHSFVSKTTQSRACFSLSWCEYLNPKAFNIGLQVESFCSAQRVHDFYGNIASDFEAQQEFIVAMTSKAANPPENLIQPCKLERNLSWRISPCWKIDKPWIWTANCISWQRPMTQILYITEKFMHHRGRVLRCSEPRRAPLATRCYKSKKKNGKTWTHGNLCDFRSHSTAKENMTTITALSNMIVLSDQKAFCQHLRSWTTGAVTQSRTRPNLNVCWATLKFGTGLDRKSSFNWKICPPSAFTFTGMSGLISALVDLSSNLSSIPYN